MHFKRADQNKAIHGPSDSCSDPRTWLYCHPKHTGRTSDKHFPPFATRSALFTTALSLHSLTHQSSEKLMRPGAVTYSVLLASKSTRELMSCCAPARICSRRISPCDWYSRVMVR